MATGKPSYLCQLDGCNVSILGRRRGTRYCTPKHRVEDFRRRAAGRGTVGGDDPLLALGMVRDWLEALPDELADSEHAVDAATLLDDLEAEVVDLDEELYEHLDQQEVAEVEKLPPGRLTDRDLRSRVRPSAPSVTNASDARQDPAKRSGSVS